MTAEEHRHAYIRAKILSEHLQGIALTTDRNLAHELVLGSSLSSRDPNKTHNPADETGSNEGTTFSPGALTTLDLQRYNYPVKKIDAPTQQRLLNALELTILSITEFLHFGNDVGEDERSDKAWNLPEDLRTRREGLAADEKSLEAMRLRIQQLIEDVNEIHPRLQEELVHVVATFPAKLAGNRSASIDLLATTIETSLLKLSIIRARAHQSLYGYISPTNPPANMMKSLSTVSERLRRDEQRMAEEEMALDRQLGEYEELLRLVDGGGGFAQVVDDWIRVQRETEECKKDLRRLGWTGD